MMQDMEEEEDTRLERSFSAPEGKEDFTLLNVTVAGSVQVLVCTTTKKTLLCYITMILITLGDGVAHEGTIILMVCDRCQWNFRTCFSFFFFGPKIPKVHFSFRSLCTPCDMLSNQTKLWHEMMFHLLTWMVSSSRFCGGLILDVKRKLPFFASDFCDALHIQSLSTILFIYLGTVTNAITFGGLLGDATENMQVSTSVFPPQAFMFILLWWKLSFSCKIYFQ